LGPNCQLFVGSILYYAVHQEKWIGTTDYMKIHGFKSEGFHAIKAGDRDGRAMECLWRCWPFFFEAR